MNKSELLASLDTFTRAYLECALWSSTDNKRPDGGDPLDNDHGIEDFHVSALESAIQVCAEFQKDQCANLSAVADVCDASRAGHNFWLNRNGHGSGFWDEVSADHELRDAFNRLSDACKSYGTSDAYLSRGKVFLT